jgi:threonine/homoserine/homoserine lactone efflux protein
VQPLPFLLVALLIVVTPGIDMALITRNTLTYGRSTGLMTAIGVNAGVLTWSVAAALGLAALVVASARIFAIVELAGAAYLIYLGVRALVASLRGTALPVTEAARSGALSNAGAFRQGLLSNLLNPKIALLFTSLLPPFAGPSPSAASLLALGGLFNLLGIAWLLTYTLLVARSRHHLERPRIRRLIDRTSGLLLVALGLRVALSRR